MQSPVLAELSIQTPVVVILKETSRNKCEWTKHQAVLFFSILSPQTHSSSGFQLSLRWMKHKFTSQMSTFLLNSPSVSPQPAGHFHSDDPKSLLIHNVLSPQTGPFTWPSFYDSGTRTRPLFDAQNFTLTFGTIFSSSLMSNQSKSIKPLFFPFLFPVLYLHTLSNKVN